MRTGGFFYSTLLYLPLEKKIHLVGWKTVCMNKDKDGLGMLNKALLCKCSWRFAIGSNSLWKMVIAIKYGV